MYLSCYVLVPQPYAPESQAKFAVKKAFWQGLFPRKGCVISTEDAASHQINTLIARNLGKSVWIFWRQLQCVASKDIDSISEVIVIIE